MQTSTRCSVVCVFIFSVAGAADDFAAVDVFFS